MQFFYFIITQFTDSFFRFNLIIPSFSISKFYDEILNLPFLGQVFVHMFSYSESRERSIQNIMKVSSKSLNYLLIFFSNSMVDRKVDS